jgi:hypothetical protein
MPSRSAPAWPLTPPPVIVATTSKSLSRPVARSGDCATIRWTRVGKYSSSERSLSRNSPVPGTRRTRAIAALRRPVVSFASVATYVSFFFRAVVLVVFRAVDVAAGFFVVVLFEAVGFLVAVFLAVVFAVVFLAVVFLAVVFLAVVFLAVVFAAVVFPAAVFLAVVLRAAVPSPPGASSDVSAGISSARSFVPFTVGTAGVGMPSHTGRIPIVQSTGFCA